MSLITFTPKSKSFTSKLISSSLYTMEKGGEGAPHDDYEGTPLRDATPVDLGRQRKPSKLITGSMARSCMSVAKPGSARHSSEKRSPSCFQLPKSRKRKASQDAPHTPGRKKGRYNKRKTSEKPRRDLLRKCSVWGAPGKLRGRKRREQTKKSEDKAPKEDYKKQLDCVARYGKNFYYPSQKKRSGLRPIYIDGSNVAFSHGQNEHFSVEGLKICIDYFRKRGHEVKAFVPHFRLRKGESSNQSLLHRLVTQKLVITTPTLYIQNQRRSPYDDWYIVQSAAANGGIIVSSDHFSDIIKWNPNLRSVIEECRLVPTFVDDMLIFPVDPHGNRQNNLEQFLKFPRVVS